MTKFEEKITNLIDLLLEKTLEGKVSWESTANNETFLSSLGLYGISIRRTVPQTVTRGIAFFGDSRPIYIVSFLDEEGKLFDSKVENSASSTGYEKLEELFTLARRSAHNVEESLDRLLQELESR